MLENFDKSLKLLLVDEGGFVNNLKDPGGATNKGITIATFSSYLGRSATVQELKDIKPEVVSAIYKKLYWDKILGDMLPAGVDYCVFDFAVNSGPSTAVKYLQRAVLAKPDGSIGPATLDAVRKTDAKKIITNICDNRLAFMRSLRTWSTFGKGWASRVAGVRLDALEMVGPVSVGEKAIIKQEIGSTPRATIAVPSVKIVVAKVGDISPYIGDLQDMLIKKGFDIQSTGVFDSVTVDTVKKFQKQNGLAETGDIDTDTLNKLMVP